MVVAASLPPRIAAAVENQQRESERLIGRAQLITVGTFGTLYTVSPKTFQADVTFAPVPWVLGAYFAFTILNGCGLLRCFLGLSVVIDRALLFGLIWSFRLQYMQPPAFSLKAPTLLYVPIFISCGRFG